MQKLMRHKGKKLTWNKAIEESFQRTKRELCEAPVLEWHVCPKHRRFSGRDIWHTPSRARMERQDCLETNSIQEQSPERHGDKYWASRRRCLRWSPSWRNTVHIWTVSNSKGLTEDHSLTQWVKVTVRDE